MKKIIFSMTILVAFSLLFATNLSNGIILNGFVTQGYVYSDGNDYFVKGSQDGSSELNELGFTLSKKFSPKFRIGFQLLSRDYGEFGNNETVLDWAFADYRWKDYLGFRVGKVKTPIGLYNEGRDVDMLRPQVFLPQSIYDESYRSYFVAFQGFSGYGNIPVATFGDIEYNAFIGNMNISREDLPMQDLLSLTNTLLNQFEVEKAPYIDMLCKDFYGGKVFFNSAYYFKLGYSFFDFKGNAYTPSINMIDNISVLGTFTDPQDSSTYTPIQAPVYNKVLKPFEMEVKFPNRQVFSFEFQMNNFTLASEYLMEELDVSTNLNIPTYYMLNDGNDTVINTTYLNFDDLYQREDSAYYIMASYLFFDRLNVFGSYENVQLDKVKRVAVINNVPQLVDVKDTYTDMQDHRTDIGFGAKFDINFNWSIKAEYHMVDGIYRSSSDLLEGVSEDSLDKEWSYILGKVSFNF